MFKNKRQFLMVFIFYWIIVCLIFFYGRLTPLEIGLLFIATQLRLHTKKDFSNTKRNNEIIDIYLSFGPIFSADSLSFLLTLKYSTFKHHSGCTSFIARFIDLFIGFVSVFSVPE